MTEHDNLADLQDGLSAAEAERNRGDLNGALGIWAGLRERHPEALAPLLRPALALRQAGRTADAETLLADAAQRFPAEMEPIWVYALLAQERGEREQAVRRFSLLLERFPTHRDSYMRIIGLLRDLGRFAEAEEYLVAAMERRPDEPWFLAQYGWTAIVRHDLAAAAQRFEACRERFPNYPDAILGTAHTLRGSGHMQQADDVLASAVARFPAESAVAFGYADHGLWMRTAGLLDWDQTLRRWETLRATFPTFQRGYVEGIRALGDAGRHDAAEALAARAVEQFPTEPRLAAEYAKRAEDRQDWPELVRRFKHMVERFPDQAVAQAGLGRALSLSGRHEEAEAILVAAMERFPRDPEPAIDYAAIANRRGDWSVEAARWAAAQQRFPDHRNIAHRLGEARMRMVDMEEDAASLDPDTAPDLAGVAAMVIAKDEVLDRAAMRQVVMQFESLGGNSERGGCEFGLFQREYGDEPLSLLRWSIMRPMDIIPALEAEFEGVGSPGNTELVLGPPAENPEYFTVDKRFGMRMHTFVRSSEVAFDTMYKQVCRRLTYLKGGLLADLRAGDKIFVYSLYPNDLDDEQMDRLFNAIRHYGDTTLLYVRSASDEHPEGTVFERAPGMLVGHIESLSKAGKTGVGAQPWPAWAKICVNALRLWKARHDAAGE